MTRKQWKKLTDENRNLLIGLLIGYGHLDGSGPDYVNDLNAMHEVEKLLNPANTKRYFKYLKVVAGGIDAFVATAEQRAEAFALLVDKKNR